METVLEIGSVLGSGWVITHALDRAPHATGGNFSSGYLVQRQDERAFAKVFDVMKAIRGGPDPMRAMEAALTAFNFERDLLDRCRQNKLSHVVTPIEDGSIDIPGRLPLHFIIFEAADGDIRRIVRAKETLDAAWLLRCMHGVCVGINQLHSIDIAHQDLKPSNVLVCGQQAKIADLGRASHKSRTTAHDSFRLAGDPMYAPPELAYGYVSEDWVIRRIVCDFFHIGSMMTYIINGTNMTLVMLSNIGSPFRPDAYRGKYIDVVPHLRHALEDNLAIIGSWIRGEHGKEIISMIRSLCDPDPKVRLDLVTASRTGPPLEWFISRLDFLSTRAASGLLRIAD